MPNYKYTAYGKDGKEIKGSVEAEDKEAALQQIKNAGKHSSKCFRRRYF